MHRARFLKLPILPHRQERELGSVCKPLPEIIRNDLPLRALSHYYCGVAELARSVFYKVPHADGITETERAMLQSSSQPDAPRVESI